jgi:ATP-dependent exoDNAse (exonuclease V) beta subunit
LWKCLRMCTFLLTALCYCLANFVIDNISDMLISGDLQPAHSAAIIYRTNAQSRYLEEACVQKGLPYVIRGGGASFYKRAEVKDCLCFMRWLHNGNDEGAMLRAVKTPSRGIGDGAMREFRAYYDEVDSFHREHYPHKPRLTPLDVLISMKDGDSNSPFILEEGAPEAAVFISKRAMNRFLPFSAQMRAIRDKAHSLTVEELLFYIIEELEMVNHFDAISKSKAEFEERRENVQELRQASKRYSKYGPALQMQTVNTEDEFASETAVGNFLDDVALVADVTAGGDEGSGEARFVVNLMTIHGSKGMEFDAVYVVGNEEGTLPSGRALQEGEGSISLEEEKRLCYVAMTRAKTRLLMTWRKEVTNFSNWSDDGPKTAKMDRSRFLDALVSKKSPKSSSPGKSNQINGADNTLQRRQRPSPAIRTAPSNQQARKPQSPSSRSFSSRPYLSNARNEDTPRAKPTATRQADVSTRSSPEPRPVRPYLSQTRSESPPPTTKRASSPAARPAPPIRPTQMQAEGNDRPTNIRKPLTRSVANERPIARPAPPIRPTQMQAEGKDRPTNIRKPLTRSVANERPKPIPKDGARTDSPTTSESKAQTKESAKIDSTWFFPVGSDVVHEKLGKGRVLEPPEGGGSNALPVLIKFQDGTEQEFCARGSDIVPDFGL